MKFKAVNLREKLEQFTEQWAPKIIARMNDIHFKLVKFQGEFVWHRHDETDETFIVLQGNMAIQFRDGVVDLCSGELFVVPRGMEHRPVASEECHIMLVEPAGTRNTGNAGGIRTADAESWI